MYPQSETNNAFLFYDPEKMHEPKITMSIGGSDYDVTRSVSSFGSISRSIEYDTGKWTPSRHSFKLENSKDFADFFFTLRHSINGVDTIGHDYWTDVEYDVNYEFPNNSTSIKLYRGVINSKTENRIKGQVQVSSTDILKSLQDKKVCVKQIADDVFDYVTPTDTDVTEIQPEIRYGKNRLHFTWATKKTISCNCVFSSLVPIDHSLITTSEVHGLVAGDYVTITGTTHYNGTFQVYRSTGWNPGIALTEYQFWIAFADSGWPSENGTLTIHDFTDSDKVNSENPQGLMVGVPNKYAAARQGESTASASTAGYLWYFPIENFIQVQLHGFYVSDVWYWDYMIGQWCRFDSLNGSNVNYGYEIEAAYAGSNLKGFYLKFREGVGKRIRSEGDYYETKWHNTDTDETWTHYLNGNGANYWISANPQPKVAIEFNGYVYTTDAITGTWLYANPVAEIYNLLASSRFGNLSTELDYNDFAAIDTSYTFDAAIDYYVATSMDYANGAQMNVNVAEESTLLSVLQDVMVNAGIMIIASSLRTADRRVRLVPVKPYVHATDKPDPILSYATNRELTVMDITSDNSKLKNNISIKNYEPPPDPNTYPPASGNYYEVINETYGAADKPWNLSEDDVPAICYYDSHTYAERTAENYLDKLKIAYEDVKLEIDDRGIVIDPGDFVSAYDHKVQEEIVVQVYSWNFNIDSGITSLNGKKVYSDQD